MVKVDIDLSGEASDAEDEHAEGSDAPHCGDHCGEAVLMRFTTLGGWASVGPRGFAAGGASYIQLKLAASDDTPYVAYSARTEGGKATVATLVDGAWSYHCVLKDLS